MTDKSVKSAWIGAAALILASLIPLLGHWYNNRGTPKAEFTYSGIVRNSNGIPVTNAEVTIAVDQSIPQRTYSDSDGVFHLNLAVTAKSLNVSVLAAGFLPYSRDVDPHRTGPEIIVLSPSTRTDFEGLSSSVGETRRSSMSKEALPKAPRRKANVESGRSDRVDDKPPTVIPPLQPACGIGVTNCNLAPNQGDQSVHITTPKSPLPQAQYEQVPLPPKPPVDPNLPRQQMILQPATEPYENHPGVELSIHVNAIFQAAEFEVNYSVPTALVSLAISVSAGGNFSSRTAVNASAYHNPEQTEYLLVVGQPLGPGQTFDVRTRSISADAVQVVGVRSAEH